MTHYILAGGADRRTEGYGQSLAEAVKRWVDSPMHILSCQFSKPRDEWADGLAGWTEWFKEYFGDDTIVELADPETFLDQVERSDIVYLHGGRTQQLIDTLSPFGNIEKYLEGKVVIGSSAGTNYLSKTYFSPKQDEMNNGTGIVPLHTIVHYGASDDGEVSLSKERWQEVAEEMKQRVGDEEVTLLPEGKFIIFEK